ncbi:hypothetical protein Vadar_019697 [Vaccinium darrowii]|uniref:Uncharacterized protein n=1 Tax=Vaccinium darrowii TaxID=229202 RepID=A0ACB7YEV2_9ERIC|nr:hypothetical protein Vadar_019697 [Vaccinium darrowii]
MEDTDVEGTVNGEANDVRTSGHDKGHPRTGDGASPGKIFIGGLSRETTTAQFLKHFGSYGEITDSVIMKDRATGQPRGFGFVTYADPSVVDKVIEDPHILNGKQVEIKRTIPKGAIGSKDFKTKKIFVGGIPTTVGEDEFHGFFSKFGEIKEHQIMRDHSTGRSRGFGFITFDTDQAVDDLLVNGNRIEFAGVQVEIKKAEPKKPNPPPPPFKRQSSSKAAFGGTGGYGDAYDGYGGAGFGAGSYRSGGTYGTRASGYGDYGSSEFGGYREGYGGGPLGGYRGEPSVGYSGRYGGGFGRGYDMGGGYGGGLGEGYGGFGGGGGGGLGEGYGGFGGGAGAGVGGGYGVSSYDAGLGSGYGGGIGGSLYGSRGGYGGAGSRRYHPYGR